ncbi:helix-turn-helix domain-containing protein [Nocardia sp. NBC_01327]|uniref:helix-turn-helix domain-containing protein n=1 Tax=Nocardia sp. NBC_01327 TaxID=2903593 RepID=UPI002E11CDF0|nr:helix-turn-helix domain-containing protein [Nocardia sp. NBC_01327]
MVSIEYTVGDVASVVPVSRYEWERMIRGIAIPSRVKYLALTMATYADPDGARIFPGQKRLALVMCVGERTVKRVLPELQALGLVARVKQGNRYAAEVNSYRLTAPPDLSQWRTVADDVLARPLLEWRSGYMTYPDGQTRWPADRHEWIGMIRRVQIPSQVKFLALMMATYANSDGTRIFPGSKQLALVMRVGVKIIDRDLPQLRELGFVELVKQGNRRGGESHEYRLSYPPDLPRRPMLDPDESKVCDGAV